MNDYFFKKKMNNFNDHWLWFYHVDLLQESLFYSSALLLGLRIINWVELSLFSRLKLMGIRPAVIFGLKAANTRMLEHHWIKPLLICEI